MIGKEPRQPSEIILGYAYLMWCEKTGFYKIGSARRPLARLKQLSREMRTPCVLLHTIATNNSLRLEREMQARFIGGLRASEWFDLDSVEVATVFSVSTVFYRDVAAPKQRLRCEFDAGSKWGVLLPVCGGIA